MAIIAQTLSTRPEVFPFDHAQEIFEIEWNCECAAKYTDLECLLMDIVPTAVEVYKDIDVRIKYKDFLIRGIYTMKNQRMNIFGTFVWPEGGKIDKVASHKITMKRAFKDNFTG